MNKNLILSISLLTSGRKKELQKCLESLLPLMNRVSSELIVVDTGCDAEHRSMIEKYATKIVDFEWCDDFAKARNAGLKEASGKWFMYLDDDEWFDDLTEIIDFFSTGEYLRYEYAMYKQRNYEDFEGKKYNDAPVGRMIRLEKDTKFVYSIHECFEHIGQKVKFFNTYVHHYGYVYATEEEKQTHAKRNIQPLLKECEKDPDNLHHVLQLMQEYAVLQEHEKAIQLGAEAVGRLAGCDSAQVFYYNSLVVLMMKEIVQSNNISLLVRKGKELLDDKHLSSLAIAYISALLSYGCREFGEYKEAVGYAGTYLQHFDAYRRDNREYVMFESPITISCFGEDVLHATLENGVMAAIACGEISKAREWNERLGWNWKSDMSISDLLLSTAIQSLWKYEGREAEDAVAICRLMMSRGQVVEFMRSQIEEMLSQISLAEQERLLMFCSKLNIDEWFWLKKENIKNLPDDAGNIWERLFDYANTQYEWNQLLLKHSLNQDGACNRTRGYETAVLIYELRNQMANARYTEAVESIRHILSIQPEWTSALKKCTIEVSRLIQKQSEIQKRQCAEFAAMAEQVKQQVHSMVESGDLTEAIKVLCQLQTLTPEDEEIPKLIEKINRLQEKR